MMRSAHPATPSRGRLAHHPDDRPGPAVEKSGGLWRIRSLQAARQVLRARNATTQAGFTAEKIPHRLFRNRPILIADGPAHDEQRRAVARFFAPAVIADRYGEHIDRCARAVLAEAVVTGRCRLDRAALHYSVAVTAEVVGLTAAPVEAMAARLTAFFRQPPVDLGAADWGRTRRQWAQAAVNGLVPLLRFHLADVAPAIRAHRRRPRADVITHLLDAGYGTADILVECLTYGTAGMVTTREFITMACWHLLTDEAAKQAYLAADRDRRLSILEEIIRLDPVVGHLYRRTFTEVDVHTAGSAVTIPAGELIDICVRETNIDPAVYGTDAEALCPARGTGHPAGLSFSDGAHRCPGQPLALFETEVLLTTLLSAGPTLLSEPRIEWDSVIEGYRVRNLDLGFTVPARPAASARER